jgi:hypothetical protein
MKNETMIFLGVLVAVGVVVFVVTRPTVAPSTTVMARDDADTSLSWIRDAVAKIRGSSSGDTPPAAPAGSTDEPGPYTLNLTGVWG